MNPQQGRHPKLVFGPFEFDPTIGDLRRYGRTVRLQGQPLRILSVLLDQPGQTVSREFLRKELWNRRIEIPMIERPDRTLLRVSHHFYTMEGEIETLAKAVRDLI